MTALEGDVTELLILWPHLAGALEKDAGTATDAVRVSGSADPALSLPVNADVLGALTELSAEVPALAYQASRLVREPFQDRTVDDHLRHMPRWHERMLVTAAISEAAELAAAVHGLLHTVKASLGLRIPDRKLGQFCPLHDDPLRELVAPGPEGTLRYDRVDRDGKPVRVAVDWSYDNAVVCRSCSASWSPGPPMLLLSRLMRDADDRRTRKTARGAA